MSEPNVTKPRVKSAVLLAAGRGKRLKPYTDTTPKPLLPVNGAPTLDLYCKSCYEAGITQIVLVVHHLADQIIDYSNKVPDRFELQCTTVLQESLNGTASALESVVAADNSPLAKSVISNAFLLMATDYLIPPSFITDLLSFHASHESDISISLKSVPEEQLASRSSVRFSDNGVITEVVEKPEPGQAPSNFSTNLAYVLPHGILNYLPAVKHSERGEREIQSAMNAYLETDGTARGLEQIAPREWNPEDAR